MVVTDLARVIKYPVVPILWGSEKKGMQTGGVIDDPGAATAIWLQARDNAVESAKQLAALGVHKSLVNRLVEPWMWITVVMTATEWENLWRLRCHSDAEIHFQKIAKMAREALNTSTPQQKLAGEWHLPYIQDDEWYLPLDMLKELSTARCARVSYLTQNGIREPQKDLDLFTTLIQGSGFGHMSPHEHVGEASDELIRSGPFIGWKQFRKEFPNECADTPAALAV